MELERVTKELRKQLIAETREKLTREVRLEEDATKDARGKVFVVEWTETDDDRIMGYGCDARGIVARIVPNVQPGIFGVSSNVPVLRAVCSLMGYEVIVFEHLRYRSNIFAPYDLLANPTMHDRPCVLVKIVTRGVRETNSLFYHLRDNKRSYKYINIPIYWSSTWQVMFERIVKCAKSDYAYEVPRVTMRWFDASLNCYIMRTPEIPLITFDIETVSNDSNRVPTGEHRLDELFSVSIHHTYARRLYTLVYMPYKGADSREIVEDGYTTDGYGDETKDGCFLEVFETERELLTRTMQLLRPLASEGGSERLHYLVGYNSMGYDIKYLLMRCAFFNLKDDLSRFVYRDGYNYGVSQIHLDLFRIILAQYKFKSYKLDSVARQLIKESKTGVDSIKLRYTFHAMRKRGRYVSANESAGRWPSVADALYYNNYDTILVTKLLHRTRSIDFTLKQAHDCRLALSKLNSNYNKMSYKLWSEFFVVGLSMGIFHGNFKSAVAPIACPISPTDECLIMQNLESHMLDERANEIGSITNASVRKKKYPGGANFCLGEYDVRDVHMLDYRIAYPLLIDRMNISDETATLMRADLVLAMYTRMDPRYHDSFVAHDYMTHTGENASKSAILYHQYIYHGLCCGKEFPFTRHELEKRRDSPVIVIWRGSRGIMSDIIARFNEIRETTKTRRRKLDALLTTLRDRVNEIRTEIELEYAENASAMSYCDNNNNGDEGNNDDGADGDFGNNDDDDGDFGNNDDDDDGDFGNNDDDDDDGDFGNNDDDDDDGDFGNNDGSSIERETATDEGIRLSRKRETTNGNVGVALTEEPKSARLAIVTDAYELDERALSLTGDNASQIVALEREIERASSDRDFYENSYQLQKNRVASIYGCVGMSAPVVAALITSLIRSTILRAARHAVTRNFTVYYVDTDSLFVRHNDGDEDATSRLAGELNAIAPHTEIEGKNYERCMFIQKKTYYHIKDGEFKYFQNVNGNPQWREFVLFALHESRDASTNADIERVFVKWFEKAYDRVAECNGDADAVLELITQEIRVKAHYTTNTHFAKYKRYLRERFPALAGETKHRVYYSLGNDVKDVELRPSVGFVSVTEQLADVNLFKFYQNMFKTVFNIIKFNVRSNNAPFRVTISNKPLLLSMIRAFLDVHERRFPERYVSRRMIDSALSVDVDNYVDTDLAVENRAIAIPL